MGQMRTIEAADGHELAVWETERSTHPYALVVLQEIFGVNHHIRTVCARFAQAGFHVIAPACLTVSSVGLNWNIRPMACRRGWPCVHRFLWPKLCWTCRPRPVRSMRAGWGDRLLLGWCTGMERRLPDA